MGSRRGASLFDLRSRALHVLGGVGDHVLDGAAVAEEVGAPGQDGGFESVPGGRSPLRLEGPYLSRVEQASSVQRPLHPCTLVPT
jgi:hypothetical protein